MVDLILDTIYVLPLFGLKINISNTFDKELQEFWKNGLENYSIHLPSICLMDVVYLLNREFRKSSRPEIMDRYSMVLPSIVNSNVVSLYDSLKDTRTAQIANKIRIKGHGDLIDCYIAATAISLDGVLLSRDSELKKVIHSMDEYNSVNMFKWKDIVRML